MLMGTGLMLLLFFGMARPATVRFERATPEERASLGEQAGGIRAATPGIALEKRGERTAVVAALGQKPTAGYGLQILRVTLRASTVQVTARVTVPPKDALVAQVITYPFDVVWISSGRLARARPPLILQLLDEKGKVLSEGGLGEPK